MTVFVKTVPGETCIIFNLTLVRRHSKHDEEATSKEWRIHKVDEKEEQQLSNSKKKKECDINIVVRLYYSQGGPWLVVNQNLKEIVKSPICVPIVANLVDGTKVQLYLRDFAGRRMDDCLSRKFSFFFASIEEASSFEFSFNQFFHRWYEEQQNEKKEGPNSLDLYEAEMEYEISPKQPARLRKEMGIDNDDYCFNPCSLDSETSSKKQKKRKASSPSYHDQRKRSSVDNNGHDCKDDTCHHRTPNTKDAKQMNKENIHPRSKVKVYNSNESAEEVFHKSLDAFKIGDDCNLLDDLYSQTQEY